MEHRVGFGQSQRVRDHRRVAAVAEHRDALEVGEVAPQLGFGGGQREFVDLDQRDAARAVPRALAAQFGADRAAGAGDQHRAPAEPAADRLPVRQHRACGRAGPRSRLPSVRPAANALRARPAGAAPCGTAGRCVRTRRPRAACALASADGMAMTSSLAAVSRAISATSCDRAEHRHALHLAAAQLRRRRRGSPPAGRCRRGAGRAPALRRRGRRPGSARARAARSLRVDAAVLPRAIQQARRAEQADQREADTAAAPCAAPYRAGCRGTGRARSRAGRTRWPSAMFHRSGTLAKRHRPRYRPTCQNTRPWASRTSAISADHRGNCRRVGRRCP